MDGVRITAFLLISKRRMTTSASVFDHACLCLIKAFPSGLEKSACQCSSDGKSIRSANLTVVGSNPTKRTMAQHHCQTLKAFTQLPDDGFLEVRRPKNEATKREAFRFIEGPSIRLSIRWRPETPLCKVVRAKSPDTIGHSASLDFLFGFQGNRKENRRSVVSPTAFRVTIR